MPTPSEIVVVPHTHWDREWYEPHDVFRLRLVHMVDGLLDLLESQPEYRFTLDGQAAAIDDYLEMRPESLERVKAAVARGQLAIGPFLILLDEFCCDGETIVRNLELGIDSSRRLGEEMRVGYLPDMFGHAAQTPQILSGFGIKDATLWRGVPDRVRRHGFRWEALNGQAVRCEYLFDGYGNGLDLFAVEGQLPELAAGYATKHAEWYGEEPVLAMLGSDHLSPRADLVEILDEYRSGDRTPSMRIDTVGGYIDSLPANQDLPVVRGELRSHARGNLLPGVFSIRTGLKEAMAAAEKALTIAERLDALFPDKAHAQFLKTAWYRVVESTAHDSVTGCGIDSTAEQVETRLNTAGHIARGVAETALAHAASGVSADDYVVVNPSGFARAGQVEVVTATPIDQLPPSQVVGELPTVLGDEQMRTADLPKILRRIHGRELFGQQINGYTWGDQSLRFDVAEVPVGIFDLATFVAELEARIAATDAEAPWHIETIAAPRHRMLFQVDLDGLGNQLVSAATAPVDSVTVSSAAHGRPVLANAALRLSINADGTADVESLATGQVLAGALRLIDEGDRGDSYNYGPVDPTSVVSAPESVQIDVVETGPLRATVRVTRTYRVPVAVDPVDRNLRTGETAPMIVETLVELRSGEDFLRATIDVTNPVSDHRLRIVVPTGAKDLGRSYGAGQYGVTERGREGEGGWGEFPLPTFPAARFVGAGGATVLLDKLTEFEVVSQEQEDVLALTLLRAVGMMSVNIHPLRDEPAGSEIPAPGAQYLGRRVVTRLAILPSPEGWEKADAARHGDLFRLDPCVVRGGAPAGAPSKPVAAQFSLHTGGSVPLESLRRVGDSDQLEARFVNYNYSDCPLGLDSSRTWNVVDMTGEAIAAPDDERIIPGSTITTFRSAK